MSTYNANNAAIKYYGRTDTGNSAYVQLISSSEAVFVVNATDCTVAVRTSAALLVSVDGGAFTDVSPTALNTDATAVVFSGLSAGDHTVVVKDNNTFTLLVASGFITTTGGTGAIRSPGANDGTGYGPSSLLLSGASYIDTGSWLSLSNFGSGVNSLINVVNGFSWSDSTLRVRARGTKGRLYVHGTATLGWSIDGVQQANLNLSTGNGNWGWVTFSTSLEDIERTYTFQTISDNGAHLLDAIMFCGSNAAFGSAIAPLPGISNYAHSQGVPASTDSRKGWLGLLAKALNKTPYNRSIAGAKIVGTSGSAGQFRTTDITGITPQPTFNFVLYGTNDLTVVGDNSTPDSTFGAATQDMLTKLIDGTTSTIHYVIGILPRGGSYAISPSTIAAWNGSGNGLQGSVTAVKTARPASASRLVYVDPTSWQLNGASGTDYATNYLDGLHLNEAGNSVVASELMVAIASSESSSSSSSFSSSSSSSSSHGHSESSSSSSTATSLSSGSSSSSSSSTSGPLISPGTIAADRYLAIAQYYAEAYEGQIALIEHFDAAVERLRCQDDVNVTLALLGPLQDAASLAAANLQDVGGYLPAVRSMQQHVAKTSRLSVAEWIVEAVEGGKIPYAWALLSKQVGFDIDSVIDWTTESSSSST